MSKIGKITIFVEKSANTQTLRIRTVGSRGTVLLNDITVDNTTAHQSPTTTSVAFWTDVLTQSIALL
jgi:hypothetical protein